ncbi:hypothetical protein SmJEL517_g01692 [Synchytrium microbalum]|uniref:Vps41 beta-propeller domain-containing protein n=1 Tax=Synchytrium microbalum TaxID=1806994 RepID=A0A507CED6_9FUNG|nr:uncharacterized protein SmJEL517_g01692 [Synchytrium microbalum]TPX35873.1 hypothetical protein SmJEL517_g01692 [Synchytrium microbalum]
MEEEGRNSDVSLVSSANIGGSESQIGLQREAEDTAAANVESGNIDIAEAPPSSAGQRRSESARGISDGQSSNGDQDSDESDDDEPKLKYQRLTTGLADLLKKDSVSCMTASERFLALGTHWGIIHILDLDGNDVKRFQCHSATVNQLSIDTHGEFIASASDDGRVLINSLYSADVQQFNYKRPVKAVSLEPEYSKKSTRHFVSGGMAELLNLSGKGWFGNKDVVLHSGEGPVYAIQWRASQIAWANDAGVKIYDTVLQQRFAYIDRPADSPRPDLYRCNICWKSDTELLIGWADSVKVGVIKERSKFDVASGLPPKYVEIVAQFRTDFIVSGIAPFNNMLVVLAFMTDLDDSRTVDVIQDGPAKRKKSRAPEIYILDAQGEEVANDVLSLNQFEHFQPNDYRLEFSPSESSFFIVSPKDVVVAKPRDLEDHIEWLLERSRYEEALRAAEKAGESYGGRLQVANILDIGQKYMNTLMGEGKYAEAAAMCPKILRQNVDLWDQWIMAFVEAKQTHAIRPQIPIKNPKLSSNIYEVVLAHDLGAKAYKEFLDTVKSWPHEVYDADSVIKAVEEALLKEPSNTFLSEAALELYTRNKQFDKALLQGLKLRQPGILDLVWMNNLYGFVSSRAVLMLEYDQVMLEKGQVVSTAIAEAMDKSQIEENDEDVGPAIASIRAAGRAPGVQILVQNTDRIPIPQVIAQIKQNPKFLHIYLDALYRKDPLVGAEYHPLQVELYAEYDYARLLDFLKSSTFYPLRKAYEICETREFIPELVFLLGKMGNNRKALFLIIERLGDVRRAIEFAKEQNDEELWNDLMKYSMDKPDFIVGLLENLGSVIDPIRLIRRIPADLEIPGLRTALIKVMHDYGVQMSLREGCERILLADTVELLTSLQRAQKRGMSFVPEVQCAMCGGQIFQDSNPTIAMVAFFCRHVYHYSCLAEGRAPSSFNVATNAFSNERVARAMSTLYARPGYSMKEPLSSNHPPSRSTSERSLPEPAMPLVGLSCPLCNHTKTPLIPRMKLDEPSPKRGEVEIGGLVGSVSSSSGSLGLRGSNSGSKALSAIVTQKPAVSAVVSPPVIVKNVSKSGSVAPALPPRAPTPSLKK